MLRNLATSAPLTRTLLSGAALALGLLGAACSAPKSEDSTAIFRELPDTPLPDASPADLAQAYPIVFRNGDDEQSPGDLFLLSLDTGERVRVTQGGDFWMPRWSPDGRSIAYWRQVDGESTELGVVAPDASGLVALSQGEIPILYTWPPNWSSDAERIAYTSSRGSEVPDILNVRIWTTSPSGTEQSRLLPSLEMPQMEATWSPEDASLIAYTDSVDFHGNEIWLADVADPSHATNLTAGRIYDPEGIRWSPDGRYIAFSAFALSADGGPPRHVPGMFPDDEIYLIEVATGELFRLTDNEASDSGPAWSPDGSSLLITSDRDGDQDLWIIPLDDPERARNLIDDNENPRSDSTADWYRGSP